MGDVVFTVMTGMMIRHPIAKILNCRGFVKR